MQLKTILNQVEKHKSFVYGQARLVGEGPSRRIEVPLRPRKNSRPECSGCGERGPVYDTLRTRQFKFIPLWGIVVLFIYAMRRVNCVRCGVKVERVPWSTGKSPLTTSYAWYLARWAKLLSWKQVARTFRTSWNTVFQAVSMAVAWGLENRSLKQIRSIGVDEVKWRCGHRYLTVVYQLDEHCRRLLWVGQDRKTSTLDAFFNFFGPRALHLRWVCSDMWKPYLEVLRRRAPRALHVLDRYHIVANLNKAIDKIRAEEAKRMKADGYEPVLKSTRWLLLRRPKNLTAKQRRSLRDLLEYNLKTVRAYLLKEDLQLLWEYVSPTWAAKFLDRWCTRAMRSKLEPLKKVARSLREHRDLILNWFDAAGLVSAGPTEGLNNKLKVAFRNAFGYRCFKTAEIALYHSMGRLPEPEHAHRFL